MIRHAADAARRGRIRCFCRKKAPREEKSRILWFERFFFIYKRYFYSAVQSTSYILRRPENYERTDGFSKPIHDIEGRDQNGKVLKFQSSSSGSFKDGNQILKTFFATLVSFLNINFRVEKNPVLYLIRIFKTN